MLRTTSAVVGNAATVAAMLTVGRCVGDAASSHQARFPSSSVISTSIIVALRGASRKSSAAVKARQDVAPTEQPAFTATALRAAIEEVQAAELKKSKQRPTSVLPKLVASETTSQTAKKAVERRPKERTTPEKKMTAPAKKKAERDENDAATPLRQPKETKPQKVNAAASKKKQKKEEEEKDDVTTASRTKKSSEKPSQVALEEDEEIELDDKMFQAILKRFRPKAAVQRNQNEVKLPEPEDDQVFRIMASLPMDVIVENTSIDRRASDEMPVETIVPAKPKGKAAKKKTQKKAPKEPSTTATVPTDDAEAAGTGSPAEAKVVTVKAGKAKAGRKRAPQKFSKKGKKHGTTSAKTATKKTRKAAKKTSKKLKKSAKKKATKKTKKFAKKRYSLSFLRTDIAKLTQRLDRILKRRS